jgi:sulfate transport system permease protein
MARHRSILPGLGPALGFSVVYISLIVLIPLSMVAVKAAGMSWSRFLDVVTAPRAVAAFELSVGASFAAALINVVFGTVVAWVLVRYPLPGKRVLDALVDIPFALPTAVGGIALTALYAKNGWIGRHLEPLGIQGAYSRLGIVIALTFIGLPFVVRAVQPVLAELEPEVEEAAACLGASRWTTLRRVVLPTLAPAAMAGFAQAFARALGEYGSVVFISGNMPGKTEIAPLFIMTKLEQFDYEGAAAVAVVLLGISFLMLLVVHRLQGGLAASRAGRRT